MEVNKLKSLIEKEKPFNVLSERMVATLPQMVENYLSGKSEILICTFTTDFVLF